jgi:halimadienyl-diphosphate synthase
VTYQREMPARSIMSTAYDTAWVAALPNPADKSKPRFPSALNWLSTHQLADGSWGSTISHQHDRIISTLAALVPLARFGRRDLDRLQLRRGERYLWQHAHLVRGAPCELVGFELLLPTLMEMATEAGVHVPPYLDVYSEERERKLALVPPEKIYSPTATIAHSVEFLGSQGNLLLLLGMQSDNGSIGNSPSATAYLLHQVDDAAAASYLERCLGGSPGQGVPAIEPCETFEALWVAYNLFLGGAAPSSILSSRMRDELRSALTADGVSLSPSFRVPDADDTAIALLLLHEAGLTVDPTVLRQFEREEYFVSFPHERHPSTGVNIHVLATLMRFPSYPNHGRAIAKILRFLKSARQHDRYWLDKWHVSPFYATSHAMIALGELPEPYTQYAEALIEDAAEWLVRTQYADGAWGFYGIPTTEETAYAILGLTAVPPTPQVLAAIDAGRAYLEANQGTSRPALWIDKCLYYPPRIVDSALHAALGRVTGNNVLERSSYIREFSV